MALFRTRYTKNWHRWRHFGNTMSPCLGGVFQLLKEVAFVCYINHPQLLFEATLLATLQLLPACYRLCRVRLSSAIILTCVKYNNAILSVAVQASLALRASYGLRQSAEGEDSSPSA